MKIALLCPTRERINSQRRLIDSLKSTTNNFNNICLYFGVDENDPFLNETMSLECDWIKVIKICNDGKFLGLGKIWNLMVKEVTEDIFMMTGDDMVFETKNWDVELLNEFVLVKDLVFMVHCNDGMRGPGNPFPGMRPLAVASFIHRSYYDSLGYYTREEWKHGYHDDWIQDVYTQIGRIKYRHDVMIRHLHFSNPTAGVNPDGVSNQLSAAFHEINGDSLYRSLAGERLREANKLRELFHV